MEISKDLVFIFLGVFFIIAALYIITLTRYYKLLSILEEKETVINSLNRLILKPLINFDKLRFKHTDNTLVVEDVIVSRKPKKNVFSTASKGKIVKPYLE